ncbi:MAG: aminopeptidase P N-terminal domain-containing protein [Pseudomonadota bacterium]|nr:aminopeptidase P N-terminal domain-containing protein [Pseudomonadota bacterium]
MNAFARRRAALLTQMQALGGGVALIPTAPEVFRNSDVEYPYRHDSSFFYLTGFVEPDAVLVLVAGAQPQSILFCRAKDPAREIWDGVRRGPEEAQQDCGVDAAYPIDAFDAKMPALLADARAIFYAQGVQPMRDAQLQNWLTQVRARSRDGIHTPAIVHDVRALIDEMRLIKDADEIAVMRRAASISAGAHRRVMRTARAGLREYELDAELLHEFRRHGSDFPAYTSIVATGANACILHYRAGPAVLQDGDLVLIDAGCELDGYASDISRTFPVNGQFSAPQRTLYEIVLAAQTAALAETRAGLHVRAGHHAALQVLAQGMLDTGLLDRAIVGSLEDVIDSGAYRQFYMHGTGHWLGMDVHDVGRSHQLPSEHAPGATDQQRPWRLLQPGMTLTVEPGIYVRPAAGVPEQYWHIGIRIEDDVAIGTDGIDILSSDAPKSVAEIEALMQR